MLEQVHLWGITAPALFFVIIGLIVAALIVLNIHLVCKYKFKSEVSAAIFIGAFLIALAILLT